MSDVRYQLEGDALTPATVPTGAPKWRFTWEGVVKVVIGLVVVWALGWAALEVSRIISYFIVGLVLAYLMKPLVDWLQGVGLGRILAIFGAYVVVFGALGILLVYLVPFLGKQLGDISQQVPIQSTLQEAARTIQERLSAYIPFMQGNELEQGLETIGQKLFEGDGVANVSAFFESILGVFTNVLYAVVVVPFVTFFVLKDGAVLRRNLIGLVPNRYFEVVLALIEKIESNLGRYFRALLIQSLSIATVASILLVFVGLDYAVAVGIFTGLANTIPYFGPLLGFLAGALMAVAQTGDFSMVPGILLAMGLTQLADNIFFQPYIFSRAARAHPLVILFVVLIGAELIGIVGMLIAIPVTTTIRVAAQQILWSVRNYRILRAT